jgi:hypothetical protein
MTSEKPSHALNVSILIYFGATFPLIATILKGFYSDPTTFRYFESAVVFPIFWTWRWCVQKISPVIKSRHLLRSVLVISTLCALIFGVRNWREVSDGYYPALIDCLDKMSESDDQFPRYGHADYWNTKPIRIFSRNNLKVAQLNANGHDGHWISSDTWSDEVRLATQSGKPAFIITTRLDDSFLKHRFGIPTKEVICAGEQVHIYNPGTN